MAECGYDIGNMTAWEDAEMTVKINTDGWTREMWEKVIGGIPIVRCKNCKHRYDERKCPMALEYYVDYDDDGYWESEWRTEDNTEDDGFCHRGERDEEDEDERID